MDINPSAARSLEEAMEETLDVSPNPATALLAEQYFPQALKVWNEPGRNLCFLFRGSIAWISRSAHTGWIMRKSRVQGGPCSAQLRGQHAHDERDMQEPADTGDRH